MKVCLTPTFIIEPEKRPTSKVRRQRFFKHYLLFQRRADAAKRTAISIHILTNYQYIVKFTEDLLPDSYLRPQLEGGFNHESRIRRHQRKFNEIG